jgi:hypothetical protein
MEVRTLRAQLEQMQEDMSRLTSVVGGILEQTLPNKKRKLEPVKSHGIISDPALQYEPYAPYSVSSQTREVNKLDELIKADSLDAMVTGNLKHVPMGRENAVPASMAFNADDEKILSSLFALDASEEINVLETGQEAVMKGSKMVQPLVDKLQMALSRLPRNIQEAFVNRMVAVIAEPEAMQSQMEALSSLTISAAQEASSRMSGSHSSGDSQSVQLAASILETYLAKFSNQHTPPLSSVPEHSQPASVHHIPVQTYKAYQQPEPFDAFISVQDSVLQDRGFQDSLNGMIPVSFEGL